MQNFPADPDIDEISDRLLKINKLVNGAIKSYQALCESQIDDPRMLKETVLRYDKMTKGIRRVLLERLDEKGLKKLLPYIDDLDYDPLEITYDGLEPQFREILNIFEELFLQNQNNPEAVRRLARNFEEFIANMIGHLEYILLMQQGITINYDIQT